MTLEREMRGPTGRRELGKCRLSLKLMSFRIILQWSQGSSAAAPSLHVSHLSTCVQKLRHQHLRQPTLASQQPLVTLCPGKRVPGPPLCHTQCHLQALTDAGPPAQNTHPAPARIHVHTQCTSSSYNPDKPNRPSGLSPALPLWNVPGLDQALPLCAQSPPDFPRRYSARCTMVPGPHWSPRQDPTGRACVCMGHHCGPSIEQHARHRTVPQ